MKSPLVEIYARHGSNPTAILQIWDIDFTLRNSMCTNTTPEELAVWGELWERTEGGLILKSGRHTPAIDETFPGHYPASGEQHSAMRHEKGGEVVSLGRKLEDVSSLAGTLRLSLQGSILVVDDPGLISNFHERGAAEPAVYIEEKSHSIALVHRVHEGMERERGLFREVAQDLIDRADLSGTHHVISGSDAVEIVPSCFVLNDDAAAILPEDQIALLSEQGLGKVTGLHNFMTFHGNRTPYAMGDSGTDGAVMNEALAIYGGGGVWVQNGKPVPEKFAEAVAGRIIDHYTLTWDHIRALNAHFGEMAPQVFDMGAPGNSNEQPQKPADVDEPVAQTG